MVRKLFAGAALGVVVVAGGPALAQEGDPAEGERVYRMCMACHVVDQEQNRVGPHLVGLFGREAGSVEGFNYSNALKESGIVWDEETLDAYLEDPRGYIPGNIMAFPGVRQEQQRADLIAYLKQATAQ